MDGIGTARYWRTAATSAKIEEAVGEVAEEFLNPGSESKCSIE
jgi:hypothetical protein